MRTAGTLLGSESLFQSGFLGARSGAELRAGLDSQADEGYGQ
jgi:hypothetical protein